MDLRLTAYNDGATLAAQQQRLDRRDAEQRDGAREVLARGLEIRLRRSVERELREFVQLAAALEYREAERKDAHAEQQDVDDLADAEEVRSGPDHQRTGDQCER